MTLNEIKIYEDDSILMVNKPSGLIVNRAHTTSEKTLQDFVEEVFTFKEDGTDFGKRSGIVHRIDKGTSGVLVLAKTSEAFANLQEQFKNRGVKKEYLALVHGEVAHETFQIDAPIKRNPTSPLKFAVVKGGKAAQTFVERAKTIESKGNKFTLLRAFPKTGRTHQIRVHLAALRYFVAGDETYCTKRLLEIGKEQFGRLMLHAHKIGFTHPQSGQYVEFEAKIPDDFEI